MTDPIKNQFRYPTSPSEPSLEDVLKGFQIAVRRLGQKRTTERARRANAEAGLAWSHLCHVWALVGNGAAVAADAFVLLVEKCEREFRKMATMKSEADALLHCAEQARLLKTEGLDAIFRAKID